MRRHARFLGRLTAIFIVILLPAVAAFLYFLGGFFVDTAAASADRTRAAVMNQADRLAFDLDLELTLLDSFLASADARASSGRGADATGAAASGPAAGIGAYSRSARWPDLVAALYVLEQSAGPRERPSATRILPADGDEYGAEILERYAGAFAPDWPGPSPERENGNLLTRTAWIAGDEAGDLPARLLVVVLDEDVLIGTVMPRLAAMYFGKGSGFDEYAVELVDATGRSRFSSLGADNREPDFERPLIRDSSRFDVERFYSSFAPRGGKPGLEAPFTDAPPRSDRGLSRPDGAFLIDRYRFQSMELRGLWTLRVYGRGLSIAAAATRQTVLWSLAAAGFLALLYGTMLMMFVSAKRAGELAAMERDFVASVTHELKTPIAVALSAGENLAKGIVPADRVASYGSVVAREARRLAESVERLLVMAGLQSAQSLGRGDPVAVGDAVGSIVARLAHALEQGGATIRVEAGGNPLVDGNRVLVESALECVMVNAIKYAGGDIRVSVREERRGNRAFVVMSCADSGPGVPRSERRKLFEPFYRGRAASGAGIQGTGIGLYLARRIARLHGGDARLRFPAEGGTVAELSFRSHA